MNKKLLVSGAVILGIICIVLAIMYWMTPAGSLPAFMPGYIAGSATVHIKHGVGAFALGLVLFVFAWFTSGKKNSVPLQ